MCPACFPVCHISKLRKWAEGCLCTETSLALLVFGGEPCNAGIKSTDTAESDNLREGAVSVCCDRAGTWLGSSECWGWLGVKRKAFGESLC